MSITSGSLLDRHSDVIEEKLSRSITTFLGQLNPVWRNTIASSFGVEPAGELGRDLLAIKTFTGSFAGVMEQGTPRSNFNLYGDATSAIGDLLHTQSVSQTFPDPTNGPNPTPFQLAIHLNEMVANLMLTLGEQSMDVLPANTVPLVAKKMVAFSRMQAFTIMNYWYLSQNDDYRLCSIATVSTAQIGATANYRITLTTNNHATNRFARGLLVDIYDSTGTNRENDTAANGSATPQTLSTRVQCIVETVNGLTNTVTLVTTVNPATGWQNSPAAGQIIVNANSKLGTASFFTGMAGINSWMKPGDSNGSTKSDNNTLLGANESHATKYINVNEKPEFQSFLKSSVGVLTQRKLMQYLATCHNAWDHLGIFIDSLFAPQAVWLNYEEQMTNLMRIDATNRLSSLNHEGMEEGFKLTFNGRTYMGFTDNLVPSQTLYGHRLGGQNWKILQPPSPKSVKRDGGGEPLNFFEFVAPALGHSGIQMPIWDTSGSISLVTEGVQTPGRIRMQLVPEQVNGMKLTGITESRTLSETA